MRAVAERSHFGAPQSRRARSLRRAPLLLVVLVAVVLTALPAASSSAAPSAQAARAHAICSGPNSAKVPCRFSTPSGDVRCIWRPLPNAISCELLATGRAYRLQATARARKVTLALGRRGKVLPLNQQLVFPDSLSCRDTRTTMTCNQDFGTGAFTLSPKGPHRS